MELLRRGKKTLIRFYSGYDTYLTAAVKFCIAFFTLYYLCRAFGYENPLNQPLLIFIIAAFCSFLPPNALILAGTVYLESQFYGCSLEAAIVGGAILLILLLLYFCFIPGQAYVVILTAVCISLKLPFVMSIACALLLGPGAAVGILFGTSVYYLAQGLEGTAGSAASGIGEELFQNVLELFQTLFLRQEMVIVLVILAAVFAVVYLIRRLPVQYSWYIAIGSGILVYVLLNMVRVLFLDAQLSLVWLTADILAGAGAGFLIRFFAFTPDYKRTEYLQFEDDEYYYYVKAVPKMEAAGKDERVMKSENEKGDYRE